ncbi:MAG: alanine racemase [Anaerolineaceae bacterium]|nr:alanine racemase [Anaerolineaceae bacterium]
MNIFDRIQKPTLLLDTQTAKASLHRMSERVKNAGIRFRPHFKTHQSAEIGEWFRAEGVSAITVSSLDMAYYFAQHGWQDITLAFPVNLRQVEAINELASRINFGILVESPDSVQVLASRLTAPVQVWIKVDTGNGRTGIAWDDLSTLQAVANSIRTHQNLQLAGLLTHAGQSYRTSPEKTVCQVYQESVNCLNHGRDALAALGFGQIQASTGDTPGASLCTPGRVDELRPGNFIFHDVQQASIGTCREEDIAVALACPIVARHPERNEVIVYGGAIHLSTDFLMENDRRIFGWVALPQDKRWSAPLNGAYVRGLSQEHGVIHLESNDLEKVQVGDLLCILPAHSCLTAHAMQEYLTLEGRRILTMNRQA